MRKQSWPEDREKKRDKMSKSFITCPKHLRLTLDLALPVRPEDNANYLYRAYLWMLFAGLDADMTLYVRDIDLDFTHMTIHMPDDFPGHAAQPLYRSSLPSPSYPIYAEAVEDLQMASTLTHFSVVSTGDHPCVRQYRRADSNRVLRPIGRVGLQPENPARISDTFVYVLQRGIKSYLNEHQPSEVPSWLPVDLTPKKIETSGKYYRAALDDSMGLLTWLDPHLTDSYYAWRDRAFH